jgi:predicted metal-dependent peptidase
MVKSNMTARERVAKARINLLTDYPFFGNLAMKLVPREVSDKEAEQFGLKTMAVDMYGNLMFYPKWVEEQSDTIMKCGVAHEVMHVCLKHLTRLGTRDPLVWNIAVDAAVNEVLSHTFKIPDQWVRIQKMAQKCAEEIYDWLIRNAQEKKNQSGKGFDTHFFGSESKTNKNGQPQPNSGGAKNSPFFQPGQQEFDVARAIRDAANFAKQQGKLPAGIERMFGDILDPILDWKDILRKFIVQIIPHDFTYTRPAKKSYSCGFYMPRVVREQVEITIGVDTSGSISDKEYAEFLSEIHAMCKQFECLKATVLMYDAEVSEVLEIDENFDPYSVHGRGYGGTSSIPVYNWIEKEKDNNIKVLVYFTDGYIDIPSKEYPFPTLWIITAAGRKDEVEKMPNGVVVQVPKTEGREDDDS